MFQRAQSLELTELVDYLSTVSAGNHNKEVDMSELEFSIDSDSNSLVAKIPGYADTMKLSNTAEKQLCSHIRMPHSYYKIISPELKLRNVKSRMATVRSTTKRVEYNEEYNLLRGFVNKGYNRVSYVDLLSSFDTDIRLKSRRDLLEPEAILGCDVLAFHAELGTLNLPFDNSPNLIGLNVRMSELGEKFSTEPMLYREVCSNGAILTYPTEASGYEISYANLDTTIARTLVKEQSKKIIAKGEELQIKLKELSDTNIKETKEVIFNFMIEDRVSKTFIQKITEKVDDTMSNWDVFNIITSEAQLSSSPKDQFRIERSVTRAFGVTDAYTN